MPAKIQPVSQLLHRSVSEAGEVVTVIFSSVDRKQADQLRDAVVAMAATLVPPRRLPGRMRGIEVVSIYAPLEYGKAVAKGSIDPAVVAPGKVFPTVRDASLALGHKEGTLSMLLYRTGCFPDGRQKPVYSRGVKLQYLDSPPVSPNASPAPSAE